MLSNRIEKLNPTIGVPPTRPYGDVATTPVNLLLLFRRQRPPQHHLPSPPLPLSSMRPSPFRWMLRRSLLIPPASWLVVVNHSLQSPSPLLQGLSQCRSVQLRFLNFPVHCRPARPPSSNLFPSAMTRLKRICSVTQHSRALLRQRPEPSGTKMVPERPL